MAGRVGGRRSSTTAWLLLAPTCSVLVLLFVVPIGYVLLLSFTDPRVSLAPLVVARSFQARNVTTLSVAAQPSTMASTWALQASKAARFSEAKSWR